jgi:hypothetical protein
MNGYLIFHTYIPKHELEDVGEDFDENLVSTEGTLSDPGYYVEGYATDGCGYDYETVLEVTREGHLLALADDNGNVELERTFQRLKALPPSKRWAEALEIARKWAGSEIAKLTGKDAPGSREEAAAALRQFLAEKAHEADEDTIRRVSNILFALAKDNCKDYPFSESREFFEDWHYLEDEPLGDADTRNSVEALAFVFVS